MSKLERLSFSIERDLLRRWKNLIRKSRYSNRSEFIRDMIRERLAQAEWEEDREAVGSITLVYDHHTRGLSSRLTDLQHQHHEIILASTHTHLDPHICMEVILVKGRPTRLQKMLHLLRQHKGVLHGTLSLASAGNHS